MTDILVNKDQWDSLSAEDQERITKGIVDAGGIQADDTVVGDAATPPFDENTVLQPMGNPLQGVGSVVCDVAATAAAAWCTANTGGIGLAVCMAIVEKGRTICKDKIGGA